MKKRWRILHLTAAVAETSGQYNEHCLPFVSERDLTICSFHSPTVVPPSEIESLDGGGSSLGYLHALRAALRRAPEYDLIHAHAGRAGVLFLLLALFRPRYLARSVYTVQNSYQNYRVGTRLLLIPIFAGYRRLVMCSESCRQSLPVWLRLLGGSRVRVVQNAVHVERVRRALETGRRDDGEKSFVVACVGRVIEIKDPLTVLDAFARTADPGWKLRFIGAGALADQVRAEARQRGLADQVEVTGLIARDKVFEELAAADVFVSASKGEGLPVAVLEALACGLPAVLSDIPPHRELVAGADFIPLVQCGDAERFASELQRLCAEPAAARRKLGTRCWKHVDECFGLPVMHAAYERVYEEVASDRKLANAGRTSAEAIPLSRALQLFRAFDEAGVIHCHFKSNEHLLEGLAGITDLDVLVERRHARLAQSVLVAAGYKRFQSRLAAAYPAMEDYLGFDPDTAQLIHVHVHYALVAGEPHLKSYQLRMADAILSARVVDPDTGVYVCEPNLELELLLLRCALKLRWRDRALAPLGRPYLRGPLMREYRWLMQRTDPERVRDGVVERLGPEAGAVVQALLERSPTVRGLGRLRSRALPGLADQRGHGPLVAFALRTTREAVWWFSAVSRRLLHLPLVTRRSIPTGGVVVALLGPDGCGKSTVARELGKWLGWKIDVYPIYFGSGDGRVSLLRWPLKIALGIYRRLWPVASRRTPWSANAERVAADSDGRDRRTGVAKVRWVWALALAREKRSRMRSLVKARNRGMAVVCDRYPQVQVAGFNDGPLLTEWLDAPGFWRRRVAAWEFEVYRALVRNAPDLAFKLNVSAEVASRRKSGVSKAEVERRLKALDQIDYGERCDHVTVDASQPLPDVLAEIKQAIWERL